MCDMVSNDLIFHDLEPYKANDVLSKLYRIHGIKEILELQKELSINHSLMGSEVGMDLQKTMYLIKRRRKHGTREGLCVYIYN